MLLQDLAIVDRIQHEMFSAPKAHEGHGEGVSLWLRELKIVSDPGVAGCAVAGISPLRDSIGEISFLEQDDQLLGLVLDVHIPVGGKVGCVGGGVETAEIVVFPCLRGVGGGLTFDYFVVRGEVVDVFDLLRLC